MPARTGNHTWQKNVSKELIHFLRYVEKSTEDVVQEENDTTIKLLHQKVKELKQRRKLEVNYMRFEELLQEIGEVPEDLRKQIESQTDLETLSQWLELAAKSASIEEFISKMA